jgi:hypothetical protein
MISVCIAVIYFRHSRVCMNSVYKHCSDVPYCDYEMYNGNTNTVHTCPTVTVKCITAIQTLFMHILL